MYKDKDADELINIAIVKSNVHIPIGNDEDLFSISRRKLTEELKEIAIVLDKKWFSAWGRQIEKTIKEAKEI